MPMTIADECCKPRKQMAAADDSCKLPLQMIVANDSCNRRHKWQMQDAAATHSCKGQLHMTIEMTYTRRTQSQPCSFANCLSRGDYLDYMSDLRTWGDAVTLHAAADYLQRPIHVVSDYVFLKSWKNHLWILHFSNNTCINRWELGNKNDFEST